MPDLKFNFDAEKLAKKIFWALLIIEITLIVLDYIFNFSMITEIKQFRRMFNIAREESIPTWFSSFQMFMVAIIMWLIYIKNKHIDNISKPLWIAFGVFFTFLSIDDVAGIHERLGSGLKKVIEIPEFFPSWSWQFFIAPIYALIGIYLLIFIWKELSSNPRLRKIFLIGLFLYPVAIALDYFEGIDETFPILEEFTGIDHSYTVSHYYRTFEEFIEMFGTTCIVYSLLLYFLDSIKSIVLKFTK